MKFNKTCIGDVTVVYLSGRLFSLSADELQQYGDRLIKDLGRSFVLNLQDVNYVSSGGLRSLIYLTKKLNKRGQQLYLTELQPKIEDIIDMSGLGAIFKVVDSEDDAIEECRGECKE